MKKLFLPVLYILLYCNQTVHAQSASPAVAINTDGANAHPSAILDVKSTAKGVLIPRMTTAQRTSIATPATGLFVYDTSTGGFWFYNGAEWENLSAVAKELSDADGDTKIQVEKTPDTDTIYFTAAGTEVAKLDNKTFHLGAPGNSLFIGRNAGIADDGTNNWNTFVGFEAGKANTSGAENTFLGFNAGFSNTTGLHNTFLGWNAGFANTAGGYNTFTGVQAGESNTTGLYNAFFGRKAGRSNTTGGKNTFLGEDAGQAHQTGDNNTFIGENAGYDHTAGESNTFIGQRAGKGNLTGSGNVFLGMQAGFSETGSHKLYIENSDSPTPLLYGEFDNNLVRVNGKLEVSGDIKVQDSGAPTPAAGTIRWNEATQDFEGYTGLQWKSLTAGGEIWGNPIVGYSSFENEQDTAPDGLDYNEFGHTVAISGDYAIVGAPFKDIGSNAAQGKVYVFIRSGTSWSLQAMLTSSDGAEGDNFGRSVAISGDYAIIGAPGKSIDGNTNQGKAYIFVRSGTSWPQQAMLVASDGAEDDNFGFSVAISGDYAAVGAPYKDVGGNTSQGRAYAFFRSGTSWSQQAMLTASDGAAGDWFSGERSGIAISGDYVVVGASGKDIGGHSGQGKAYVFFRSGTTWSQQAMLTASDGDTNDDLGYSVSISGDYAILGARLKDIGGNTFQGKAYIFFRSGTAWSQQAMLTASDGAADDRFGSRVAISGNNVIVSADFKDINGNTHQGKAYIFFRSGTTWSQQAMLTASDGAVDDFFGGSVAISGDNVIVSAPLKDVDGNISQGKIYFFNK